MRLQVYMGTQEEYDKALAHHVSDDDIRSYYEQQLELAPAGTSVLDFQSIPAGMETSESFRIMGLIEDAVMVYLRTHDNPETVRIVCTDEEIARLYKVVYNFRFADTKANRMEDDNWD